jgi:Uma2 family endonuclease
MGVIKEQLTGIDAFLQLPEFKPALDYYDGRAIQKMSPKLRHSIIQGRMYLKLAAYIESVKEGGAAYPELRCRFRKRSFVFDLSYFREGRIPILSEDDRADVTEPPDLAIEILSPGQPLGELKRKFRSAIRGGVGLGWLIDPIQGQILIFRPASKTVVLKPGEMLTGEAVLPGFAIPVEDIFGWSR